MIFAVFDVCQSLHVAVNKISVLTDVLYICICCFIIKSNDLLLVIK